MRNFNAFYTFYFAYFCIICFIYGTWALINGCTLFPSRSYQRVDVIFAMQIIYINCGSGGFASFRLIDAVSQLSSCACRLRRISLSNVRT